MTGIPRHPLQKLKRVVVVPYDARWLARFASEERLIREALEVPISAVHHIGSTSVEGLAAKPIIDIMLVVAQIESLDGQTDAMAAIGYEAWGEHGIPGRRYFTKGGPHARSHQVHAFAGDNPAVARHLAFRDYLRAHPEVTREYAALKQRAASDHPTSIDAYMDAKDAFIKHHEALALEWAKTD